MSRAAALQNSYAISQASDILRICPECLAFLAKAGIVVSFSGPDGRCYVALGDVLAVINPADFRHKGPCPFECRGGVR